jgi:hypothetical protein
MSHMEGFSLSGSSLSASLALPQVQQRGAAARGTPRSGGGSSDGGGGGGAASSQFRPNATRPQTSASSYGQQRRSPDDPIAMERATHWSPEVEEAYRIQGSGWRSIREYRKTNGDPARWENGFVRMTVHPKTGFFSTCRFSVLLAWRQQPPVRVVSIGTRVK